MTLAVSQDTLIEESLMNAVDKYPTKNKSELITIVVDELGVPRPTVRRVKSKLLMKLSRYAEILT